MPITRRFMLIAAVLFILITSPTAAQRSPRTPTLVAAVGDADQTSAVLWIHSPNVGALAVSLTPTVTLPAAAISDPLLPVKLDLSGLSAGTVYTYQITDAGGLTLNGSFRTPAPPDVQRGLRFGITVDWQAAFMPYIVVRNAPAHALDFFVLLGDTVYADVTSPDVPLRQAQTLAQFRAKHAENMLTVNDLNLWRDIYQTTPIYATLDDHEITDDFAGGAPPASDNRFDRRGAYIHDTALFQNGYQAFLDYMPIRAEVWGATGDPRTAGKPNLYRYRTFGKDAALFVLDARTFRDASLASPSARGATDPAAIRTFLNKAYDPTRTMLGAAQLAQLKADLLAAQAAGILWKVIAVPQPIQQFGVFNAGDRFEGYAAERADLLDFMVRNGITNAVFVAADFHGTFVNNLTYALTPGDPQIETGYFEIVTGAVAVDPPFGTLAVTAFRALGAISQTQYNLYQAAPRALKDTFAEVGLNTLLMASGYDPLGLVGSGIAYEWITGGNVLAHTFGWTAFEIDAEGVLTVTTYGIPAPTPAEIRADPTAYLAYQPEVLQQFRVTPR